MPAAPRALAPMGQWKARVITVIHLKGRGMVPTRSGLLTRGLRSRAGADDARSMTAVIAGVLHEKGRGERQ